MCDITFPWDPSPHPLSLPIKYLTQKNVCLFLKDLTPSRSISPTQVTLSKHIPCICYVILRQFFTVIYLRNPMLTNMRRKRTIRIPVKLVDHFAINNWGYSYRFELCVIWFFQRSTASARSFCIPIKYPTSKNVCLFLNHLTPSRSTAPTQLLVGLNKDIQSLCCLKWRQSITLIYLKPLIIYSLAQKVDLHLWLKYVLFKYVWISDILVCNCHCSANRDHVWRYIDGTCS